MNGQGTLWALRIAMWVLIVVAAPVYLVWLARVGYLTGQRPEDDVTRWAPAPGLVGSHVAVSRIRQRKCVHDLRV
ncbi:hypothetical protein ABZY09_35250 [Streptomyces sp. NPDC002928]|uniref:hypothetical protein n=1 Tax=Streptomyces sp. NPDC002928 TaxID=3154440 RepID=UPI0033A6C1F3